MYGFFLYFRGSTGDLVVDLLVIRSRKQKLCEGLSCSWGFLREN